MTWSDIPGDDPMNAAMIKRDEPAAAPVDAGEDPLAAVRAAIENLRDEAIQCAIDECANSGRRDPDYSRADAAEAELLDEVRKLLVSQVCGLVARAQADQKAAQAPIDTDPGLTVEHRPGDRWSVTL